MGKGAGRQCALVAIAFVALWGCNKADVPVPAEQATTKASGSVIEWHDADSGYLNGERFRVYSMDAPETGGVGSAVGAAPGAGL